MKLLCLCLDETLNQQICHEADQLHWNAVVLRDRGGIQQAVKQHDPDLLLVEVAGLADLDWWKDANYNSTAKPVIFMPQEINAEFFAQCLDSGADAFLPKSMFSPHHFEARIKSMLRRREHNSSKRFVARVNLSLDAEHLSAEAGERRIPLTLTEFKILRELATEEAKVISRQEIQARVFGSERLSTRSLDVHVCALRKKVRTVGLDIDSVRGVGYRLTGDQPAR